MASIFYCSWQNSNNFANQWKHSDLTFSSLAQDFYTIEQKVGLEYLHK